MVRTLGDRSRMAIHDLVYPDQRFPDDTGADIAALVDAAARDLTNYGATVTDRSIEETETTVRSRLGIHGPLYTGDRRSVSFVRLEVNKRRTVSDVHTRRYTPPFPDIPSVDLAVLGESELLAEKIRALATREQPRDLYDCYHLLSKGVTVDGALVREKLDYYGLDYDPDAILDAVGALESSWSDLDALTYSALPSFSTASTTLRDDLVGQSEARTHSGGIAPFRPSAGSAE